MPFKPGQSGNPEGRRKEKKFAAALERAIIQDDGNRLRQAAEKLLDLAAGGEAWAIGMLADRLDGKPQQETSADVSVSATVEHVAVQELARAFGDLRTAIARSADAPTLPH